MDNYLVNLDGYRIVLPGCISRDEFTLMDKYGWVYLDG